MDSRQPEASALRRDLGTIESYAVLIGILVGAGIFKVTSTASAATGPSVILGHLVLAPAVLASTVAYTVFLSTPLGLEPGGEAMHISRTFGSQRLAFVCAWLKLISYLGAGAYLAVALADYSIELVAPGSRPQEWLRRLVALAGLIFFLAVHLRGVRWFGRLQVWMCAVLALAIVVLVVPGLFAIELENYRPFFTAGGQGFVAALPPLFFAYAGFEALAQTAGEVRDSSRRLPRIFLRGVVATAVVFLLMSVVAFGVLPSAELEASEVPMSAAAARYLPFGATVLVTIGAVMAVATSLNATMLVPARLAWILARRGLLPRRLGELHSARGTPVAALLATFTLMAALLLSGQFRLALTIAVVALVALYGLHSAALLALPRRNPELYGQVTSDVPRPLQVAAGWLSLLAMGGILGVQFYGDVERIAARPLLPRLAEPDLTSLELLLVWSVLGLAVYLGRPEESPL